MPVDISSFFFENLEEKYYTSKYYILKYNIFKYNLILLPERDMRQGDLR